MSRRRIEGGVSPSTTCLDTGSRRRSNPTRHQRFGGQVRGYFFAGVDFAAVVFAAGLRAAGLRAVAGFLVVPFDSFVAATAAPAIAAAAPAAIAAVVFGFFFAASTAVLVAADVFFDAESSVALADLVRSDACFLIASVVLWVELGFAVLAGVGAAVLISAM
ncbi:membrane hypothetical protein [Sphingomonas sp. AX6]|nr:membrane hypothetical protein [Sphingomonas sp. AX6]